ncbi:hypothetical protein CRX72_16310 [Pantoea sp. BRM17]|nr:hypothetical protein CRX72_16310 [Pantoea sp. BRM17]
MSLQQEIIQALGVKPAIDPQQEIRVSVDFLMGHRAGSASAVIGVTMFTLGAISVPVSGVGGTSVISMSATIFGCFMLAILMFTLLAQRPESA